MIRAQPNYRQSGWHTKQAIKDRNLSAGLSCQSYDLAAWIGGDGLYGHSSGDTPCGSSARHKGLKFDADSFNLR